MNTGILYISCGVPGSGKSTFLKEMVAPDEIVISRDEIRFSLLRPGEEYFAREKETYERFTTLIRDYINNGISVYADATHLNEKSRYSLLHKLKNKGCKPREVNAIYFNTPLTVCLERNELRKGTKTYVPEEQIEKMFAAYIFPEKYEGFSNIWEVSEDGNVTIIK